MTNYSYLALGDSYTVGEQVRLVDSFPYQLVYRLREYALENGLSWTVQAPEIVAVTGYTTDELSALINTTALQPRYDLVTLLIGVNNQYRERPIEEFSNDFGQLLTQALRFAGGNRSRTFVLSIPDWGVTPYAENRNRLEVAAAIDAYNSVCREYANRAQVTFLDITSSQRVDGHSEEFLAWDKLHPSAREYQKWADQLYAQVLPQLNIKNSF